MKVKVAGCVCLLCARSADFRNAASFFNLYIRPTEYDLTE